MQNPINLYYWPTPNGWKISIALEEMGLPYTLHLVNIGAGDQFKPEFLKIAPNNRMPAIVDPAGPDDAPVSIFESGAILQYLARKTGQFGGKTERDRIAIEQWLMWQMGGVGPMAGQAHHFLKYAPAMDPPNDLPYAKEVEGYPGLVIAGPLMGDWLTQCVLQWLGEDGRLARIEYSNRQAAYIGETLTTSGRIVSVDAAAGTAEIEVAVTNETGDVITPGSATVRFHEPGGTG